MVDLSSIRNFYWRIRFTRNPSEKRKYYRYVFKEKKRLIDSGVDAEYLRLYCRSLSKRFDHHAEKRLKDYQIRHFLTY
ncbi:hypothetical protein C8R27_1573 [Nitrosomonas ureae]|nr:hypothetical protein C8R27_1573 [Nitrosomonas ureae]